MQGDFATNYVFYGGTDKQAALINKRRAQIAAENRRSALLLFSRLGGSFSPSFSILAVSLGSEVSAPVVGALAVKVTLAFALSALALAAVNLLAINYLFKHNYIKTGALVGLLNGFGTGAILFGAANAWNPAGWIMLGSALLIAAFGCFHAWRNKPVKQKVPVEQATSKVDSPTHTALKATEAGEVKEKQKEKNEYEKALEQLEKTRDESIQKANAKLLNAIVQANANFESAKRTAEESYELSKKEAWVQYWGQKYNAAPHNYPLTEKDMLESILKNPAAYQYNKQFYARHFTTYPGESEFNRFLDNIENLPYVSTRIEEYQALFKEKGWKRYWTDAEEAQAGIDSVLRPQRS